MDQVARKWKALAGIIDAKLRARKSKGETTESCVMQGSHSRYYNRLLGPAGSKASGSQSWTNSMLVDGLLDRPFHSAKLISFRSQVVLMGSTVFFGADSDLNLGYEEPLCCDSQSNVLYRRRIIRI